MSSMDISTYNNKPSKFDPNAKMSEKEIRAKEKESFKGLNFKELSHEFGPKDNDAGMHSDVVKGGQDQLLFAQKLLLKQLQCQTPDSSVDPNKMLDAMMGMLTIAQNSEMVKMQKQNMELQKALFYTSFSSFEGEVVEHTGNEFDYNDQDQEIVFNLPAKTDKATLAIYDERNQLVKRVELDKKVGRNSFIWDGKSQNGEDCPKGIYKTVYYSDR
jgi:flagellar basal-body rod modification protein FlgD